eukprot:SAG31_NODE_16365_length_712_cov_0.628059_1_plen_47_part_10
MVLTTSARTNILPVGSTAAPSYAGHLLVSHVERSQPPQFGADVDDSR